MIQSWLGASVPDSGSREAPMFSSEVESLLPIFALPQSDVTNGNGISAVWVAEYENGIELSVKFDDEDRPTKCGDMFYDAIRKPLFGRSSDIETIFFLHKLGTVHLPGTASGDSNWASMAPQHLTKTIPLKQFESDSASKRHIFYVNTWSHLMGEKNNNTQMSMVRVAPAVGLESSDPKESLYTVLQGSRAEVDAQFRGCCSSVSKVMTDDTKAKLGRRIA